MASGPAGRAPLMRDHVEKTKSGSPSPSRSPAAIALATSVLSAAFAFNGSTAQRTDCPLRSPLPPVCYVQHVAAPARPRDVFAAVADEVEIAVAFDVDEQDRGACTSRFRLASSRIAAPKVTLFGVGRRVEI